MRLVGAEDDRGVEDALPLATRLERLLGPGWGLGDGVGFGSWMDGGGVRVELGSRLGAGGEWSWGWARV